uniref:Arf-GAP with coiled-coil, ANK repeat and PH domain-containing protein n=1 Tax=Denticeps clupeoides TaxID=299321 RepID=A0AAY4A2C8_9TELE
MKVTVDFEECLKDSPRFRATIEDVELDVAELESKLDKLIKLCIGMIDAGRAYNMANKQFVNGIRDLALQSTKDTMIEVKAWCQDLRKFKETKKHFDKVSEEKEVALVKNAQVPRSKQHEVEEATSILTTTRKCFRHIALDYVLQINVLQSKRRSEILKSMLSFMYAHLTFFHQGYDLFSELQPLMKQLSDQLDQLVVDSAKDKRDMEQKHSTIQQKDLFNEDTKLEYNVDTENGIAMEGYLFKRASNAFKSWNRRWFSIQNSQLVYQKKFKDNLTVVVEDLRLCTVKPVEDIERRFCFEVVSPTKSCVMQADSENLRQAWIKAVQNSIATAFRENGEEPAPKLDKKSSASLGSLDSGAETRSLKAESALQRVLSIPGNDTCCDCGQTEPRWASINLGITLCIECSGIHRSLGVHNSKVRSLTLDSWEPELLKLMCELGNGVINRIYEARREEMGERKPQPGDPRSADSGIQNSTDGSREMLASTPSSNSPSEPELPESESPVGYQRRESPPVFSELTDFSPGLLLYWASCACSLPDMAEALAHGADVNWVNTEDCNRTPLIQAVQGGSLITCEFLLQNAAIVDQQDIRGRGPLHHATILGHTGQVCLFLKRGAKQNAVDTDGRSPLSIAVEAANADIVTLLRLARMNEEMREQEGTYGQPEDDTCKEIFRDFSQMASNHPEKLNRF